MRRIGAIFTPASAPERLRSVALAADTAGVPELWLWEDCFRESAYATAAAVLAWTENLRVGIGVSPMPLRNVALLAMEIATVERLFPGRLIPGIGHGVLDWMGQVGARVASPLSLMREYAPALRGLLSGGELSVDGRYVRLDAVRLDWPPASAPSVLAAGEGPKTLRLTGEVADGTIVPAGWSPARVREAVALVREGREAAGRPGEPEFVVFVTCAFGGADAVERVRADLKGWLTAPDEALDISGDPVAVRASIEPFYAAGATSVILQPTADEPDLEGFMARVGEVAKLLAS